MFSNNTIKIGLIMIFGPIIGLVLLLLVYLLPIDAMARHIYDSRDLIISEFEDEVQIDGYRASLTGCFTDCLMLEHAIYENKNHTKLEQALRMYRGEIIEDAPITENWAPGRSLIAYLQGIELPSEVEYGRYWHGYLVILKPLLMLTSVSGIRLLNSAFQLLLVGIVVMQLVEKKKKSLAFAFLISMPFMWYFSSYASLSLSICLYLVLLWSIVFLNMHMRIERQKSFIAFFMVVGMTTAYFDFLTYPLVTLGYMLVLWLALCGKGTAKDSVNVLQYSIAWGGGFGWMWGSKWVLCDILTNSKTIQDALKNVFIRSASAEGQGRIGGFLPVLAKNLQPYVNWTFILLFIFGIGYSLFQIGRNKEKKAVVKSSFLQLRSGGIIAYFMVALFPMAWFFLMQNHSEQHWIFTCRIISVSVFALFGIVGYIIDNSEAN